MACRAPVDEAAAGLDVDLRRDFALNRVERSEPLGPRIGFGVGFDEKAGIGVFGIEEHRVGWACLHQMAKVHHSHAVRHIPHHRQVGVADSGP